jgi:uncharacterized repeat protein (TIGR03803 family)
MRSLVILSLLPITVAAACSQQSVSPPLAPATRSISRPMASGSFSTIYSFKGSPDGSHPESGLTVSPADSGRFFGTTRDGGEGSNAVGTVFDVRTDGTEHVLHTFTGKPDGSAPRAGVVVFQDAMYGTTYSGGTEQAGIIYAVSTSTSGRKPGEHVVYNFTGKDGAAPLSDLTFSASTMYGTTLLGGAAGKGVVFEAASAGSELIVHSFTGNPDGGHPQAGLVEFHGALYGTTGDGGSSNDGCVFEVEPGGQEQVIHSFNGSDGALPRAGLVDLNDTLYGVASQGGSNSDGVVFDVHKDGSVHVIHNFNGSDGRVPIATLTVMNGLLYGTTEAGGSADDGTVFEVYPDGTFRTVHSFAGTDGAKPAGQLLVSSGALLGTTREGGANSQGTVFKVVP